MSEDKTNELAFPSNTRHTGMTLRDYFAAKALVALLMADGTQPPAFVLRAKEAYLLADAMLEARRK